MVQLSAASYDSQVAGIDEASARRVLAAMQDRLARDPSGALGLGPNATIEQLRTAFLELTKQFHPVRFGRMAVDIQKQSNEVFLALRAAHDSLNKTLRRRSGPIPTVGVTSASSSGQVSHPQAQPRSGAPATASSTNATNARPGSQPPIKPATARTTTGSDSSERAAIQSSPSSGVKAMPGKQSAPAAASRPGPSTPVPLRTSVGTAQPRSAEPSGGTARAAAAKHTGAGGAPINEAGVIDLLQRQQWDQARSALHQLAARDPSSKKIRALTCYARGREAQLSGRIDDARVELQDALDLDPDLMLAKTALTELFTRRK